MVMGNFREEPCSAPLVGLGFVLDNSEAGEDMADYTEVEWRSKYRPTKNPANGYDSYTPGEAEVVLKFPKKIFGQSFGIGMKRRL
jgi:hypothetical protein